jgi:hypothetical protein
VDITKIILLRRSFREKYERAFFLDLDIPNLEAESFPSGGGFMKISAIDKGDGFAFENRMIGLDITKGGFLEALYYEVKRNAQALFNGEDGRLFNVFLAYSMVLTEFMGKNGLSPKDIAFELSNEPKKELGGVSGESAVERPGEAVDDKGRE